MPESVVYMKKKLGLNCVILKAIKPPRSFIMLVRTETVIVCPSSCLPQ